MGVKVTDKFMEVSANSWIRGLATYLDPQMSFKAASATGTGPKGMGASPGSASAVCRKRISGTPTPMTWTDVVVSVDNPRQTITVKNISGRNIPDVAVAFPSSTLRSWDYTDTCSPLATPHLTVANNLAPGESVTIPVDDPGLYGLLPSQVLSFGYQVVASPASVSVGPAGVNVNLTTIGGASTAFTVTADQPWVQVTTNSNTTPATLTITLASPGPFPAGNVIVTPADSRFGILQIPVAGANQPLNITANLQGTSVSVNGTLTPLPTTNLVVAPGTAMTLLGTTISPSPGTQYRFANWSQSGGNPLQFPMPAKPVSLTATFSTFYAVTLASNPPIGGQVTVVNPSADGYYRGGQRYSLAVQAAPGYLFRDFSGDLTGTNLLFGVSAPMAITANFVPVPTITFQTNTTAPIPITVGGTTTATPFALGLQPGPVTLSVPAVYSRPQVPGVQYLFVKWSDGVTSPLRTFTVGQGSMTLSAEYVQQVQVQVLADPPAGGSLTGAGWYDVGSNVTVTATANPGFGFVRFFGPTRSATNPVTLPVGPSPMTVGAIFQRPQGTQ